MAKGGGGGGGAGGAGGAGGRSAGGGGSAGGASVTGVQAIKELKKLGLEVDGSARDVENSLKQVFSKTPTLNQLKAMMGVAHMNKEHLSGYVRFAPDSFRFDIQAPGVQLKRSFSSTGVYHDHLFLSKAKQGTGLGSSIIRDQVREYRKLGVKKISLYAIDVGKYYWPKIGFSESRKDFAINKREFGKYLASQGVKNTREVLSKIKTTRDISVAKVDGRSVGKEYQLSHKSTTTDLSIRLSPKDKGFKIMQKELGL